jgi:uncharacterized membrane protein YtjA (UPF0391 family)
MRSLPEEVKHAASGLDFPYSHTRGGAFWIYGDCSAAAGIAKFLFFLFLVACLIFFYYRHVGRQKNPIELTFSRFGTISLAKSRTRINRGRAQCMAFS